MLIWVVLLFAGTVGAQSPEVLVKHPSSSETDYRAYLMADSGLISPTRYLLRHRSKREARQKLMNAFAEAQKAFLGDQTDSAKRQFSAVTELALSEDWELLDREILLTSFLRLAQLSEGEARRGYLVKSLAFADGAKLDESLFPPPLLEEWRELKRKLTYQTPVIKGLGTDWSTVLINGAVCDPHHCPALPIIDEPIRITWISDSWQTQSTILKLSELETYQPKLQPWLEGTCQNPQFAKNLPFAKRRAFFSLQCEQPKTLTLSDLKPKASPKLFDEPIPEKKKPFYKSPWVWAGAATIVAILIANQNKKNGSERREPTTTYGY